MLFKFSIAALISSALMVHASFENLGERGPALAQVITSCTKPRTAALTFDDGPYDYIENISKQLIAAGGKGTFFWNGNNWRCIYNPDSIERAKYIYGKGHQVASHTWAHANLTTLNRDQLHDEFWRVEQALQRILGITPAFMRPPFGSYNDLVRQVAHERGQKMVIWDFDSGDSTGSTPDQSNAAYDDLAKRHPSNVLALNHEVFNQTVNVVIPHAIKTLKAAGYNLVTVAECLGEKPYQSVKKPESGSWTC